MNPRHTAALLLIAFGAFLGLVGAIFGGVGLQNLAAARSDSMAEMGESWAIDGGVTLLIGVALLIGGVWVYRRSDHRLVERRDACGRLIGQGFPILSPMLLVLFLLTTILLGVSVSLYGMDWSNSRAVRAYLAYAGVAVLFLGAGAVGLYRWLRGEPGKDTPDSAAEKQD